MWTASLHAAGCEQALHLLHDPFTLAEKLFAELRRSSERFEVRLITAARCEETPSTLPECERLEVRLLMINLLSRLVGAHRLQLPNFFPYLQRYLQPHQRDITLLLAYLVQEETSPLLPSPHCTGTAPLHCPLTPPSRRP